MKKLILGLGGPRRMKNISDLDQPQKPGDRRFAWWCWECKEATDGRNGRCKNKHCPEFGKIQEEEG